MKVHANVLIVAGLLLFVSAGQAGLAQTDQERLQGTWRLVSIEANQRVMPIEEIKIGPLAQTPRLCIAGEKYLFKLGDNSTSFTFTLNPGKSPKEIDMMIVGDSDKGKLFHGIYLLAGDTYKVCRHVQPNSARPIDFATRANSGILIITWKREQSTAGRKPPR
jgi:uncharacterized protein (TIGR03067 family)